ncbi:hypothetical protein BJ742DRAFT_819675 [Cladochytrium replicatum]|nr:hypothetical protein BJ742DRAFT_819675 [Cladochytrium replicatum]
MCTNFSLSNLFPRYKSRHIHLHLKKHPKMSLNSTLFVLLPKDKPLASVHRMLLDQAGLRRIHYATDRHLFAVFNSPDSAENARIALTHLGFRIEEARTNLSEEKDQMDEEENENDQNTTETSNILSIMPPRQFPTNELPDLLRDLATTTNSVVRVDLGSTGSGWPHRRVRATFTSASEATKVLDHLSKFTNISATYSQKVISTNGPHSQPEDAMTSLLRRRSTLNRSGSINSGVPASSTTAIPGASLEVSGVVLDIAPLRRSLLKYRGALKVSFQSTSSLFLDFTDVESATNAMQRINSSSSKTQMRASITTSRGVDPGHFALEKPAASVFVRLETWFTEATADSLFSDFTGFKGVLSSTSSHAIMQFDTADQARTCVLELRNTTNLVVNFAKSSAAGPDNGSNGRSNRLTRTGSSSTKGQIEWPAIRLFNPPLGLNIKELFALERGFLQLVFEDDGSYVGLYSSIEEAKKAREGLLRVVSSEPALTRREMFKRPPFELFDPTRAVYIQVPLPEALTEGQMRRLMQSYEGLVDLRYSLKSSGDAYCLVRFTHVADAKRALEDLLATTNLNVNFSKMTESSNINGGPAIGHTSVTTGRLTRKNSTAYSAVPNDFAVESPKAMTSPQYGTPKRTLYVTSPPPNKAQLKQFVAGMGASRTLFRNGAAGSEYCFIVFETVDMASKAIPKILERWPACSVEFARAEFAAEELEDIDEGSSSGRPPAGVRRRSSAPSSARDPARPGSDLGGSKARRSGSDRRPRGHLTAVAGNGSGQAAKAAEDLDAGTPGSRVKTRV